MHSRSHYCLFDWADQGAHAGAIAAWFDSLVGEELSAFKARSLIIDVIGAR